MRRYCPEGQMITLYIPWTRTLLADIQNRSGNHTQSSDSQQTHMVKLAIYAQMEAKLGKEADVEAFLKSA
jgi:hypothetical protein